MEKGIASETNDSKASEEIQNRPPLAPVPLSSIDSDDEDETNSLPNVSMRDTDFVTLFRRRKDSTSSISVKLRGETRHETKKRIEKAYEKFKQGEESLVTENVNS